MTLTQPLLMVERKLGMMELTLTVMGQATMTKTEMEMMH